MVSTCPDEADPALAQGCNALLPDRGYIHDLPVIAGGILYKNVYCAYCYGLAMNDLFPLKGEISCEAQNVTNEDVNYQKILF
jgi:hypothetical protein